MTPFQGTNRVTSPYGWRTLNGVREHHNGQDIVGDNDKTVRAIWDCARAEAVPGYNAGRGNLVRLYYSPTLRAVCQHLDGIAVKTGQAVKQGDAVGTMGNTGYSFGAHLHIEVQVLQNGVWAPVNPALYTEVPNAAGRHPGNNTLDAAQKPAPEAPPAPAAPLYTLAIGPMTKGDMLTLQAQAEALCLPVTGGTKGAAS